jgi:branched-chain amino acid aminotransferase
MEIFGSGTAAVISPVGELKYNEKSIHIGGGKVGPIAHRLFETLTDIQYGKIKDPMGWVEAV